MKFQFILLLINLLHNNIIFLFIHWFTFKDFKTLMIKLLSLIILLILLKSLWWLKIILRNYFFILLNWINIQLLWIYHDFIIILLMLILGIIHWLCFSLFILLTVVHSLLKFIILLKKKKSFCLLRSLSRSESFKIKKI